MISTSNKIADAAYKILTERQAEDISVIDISNVADFADIFIIATAKNTSHLQALIDHVEDAVYTETHEEVKNVEGRKSTEWVLIDYDDVVVHLFSNEARHYYALDKNWIDGNRLN